MLNLEVEFTSDGWDLSSHAADVAFKAAVCESLSIAARECVVRLKREAAKVFDNPTPYTLNAFGSSDARMQDPEPSAFVFVYSNQAQYLELEVFGGVRQAGDYATTPWGPLVPMMDGFDDLNVYGNFPQGKIQQLQNEGARWVKNGDNHYLIKHSDGESLFLAMETPEAHYKTRLDFGGVVESTVNELFGPAFLRAWESQ